MVNEVGATVARIYSSCRADMLHHLHLKMYVRAAKASTKFSHEAMALYIDRLGRDAHHSKQARSAHSQLVDVLSDGSCVL